MPTGVYKRTKPAWNKGKKLHYSVWNKGVTGEEYLNHFIDGIKGNPKGYKPNENQLRGLKIGHKLSVKHSDESKFKNSIAHSGSNNICWKGGTNKWRGHKWNKLRKEILIRDEYKCTRCGKEATICHHKIPWKLKRTYDKNLIISLCRSCHMKLHYEDIEGGKNA